MKQHLKTTTVVNRHRAHIDTNLMNGRHQLRHALAERAMKRMMTDLIINKCFVPVLIGKVGIKEVVTPAGGWAAIERLYPNFSELPHDKQLYVALYG